MREYIKNLGSAFRKLRKNQSMAANQLVYKEKEAIIVTSSIIGIPIVVIIGAWMISFL